MSLLDRAREIANDGTVKGYSAVILRKAANEDPELFSTFLADIATQALDPRTQDMTMETFGEELTLIAVRLFGKLNENKIIIRNILRG